MSDDITKYQEIKRGIKQSLNLQSNHFSLYSENIRDEMLKIIFERNENRSHIINNLRTADDIALIPERESCLHKLINRVSEIKEV